MMQTHLCVPQPRDLLKDFMKGKFYSKCKPGNYTEEAFMSHQPSTKLKEMNLYTLLAGAP